MTGRDYDFWLLDLDGTVVDIRREYIHEVFTEVGDRLGCGFSRQEAEQCWYGHGTTREELFSARGLTDDRFWEVFHQVDDPTARAQATYLYDDAADVVPELDDYNADSATAVLSKYLGSSIRVTD